MDALWQDAADVGSPFEVFGHMPFPGKPFASGRGSERGPGCVKPPLYHWQHLGGNRQCFGLSRLEQLLLTCFGHKWEVDKRLNSPRSNASLGPWSRLSASLLQGA